MRENMLRIPENQRLDQRFFQKTSDAGTNRAMIINDAEILRLADDFAAGVRNDSFRPFCHFRRRAYESIFGRD